MVGTLTRAGIRRVAAVWGLEAKAVATCALPSLLAGIHCCWHEGLGAL